MKVIGIKVSIFILAISAIFFLAAISILSPQQGVVETVDDFFGNIQMGDYADASNYLAEDFRISVPAPGLKAFFERAALQNFKESKWGTYCVSGDTAELEGHILRKTNDQLRLKMKLVREADSWKISAVQPLSSNPTTDAERFGVPPLQESAQIARATTLHFAQAVNAKDLTLFRRGAAKEFRERFSAQEFNKAFGGFITQGINLAVVEKYQPVFTVPPQLTRDGILHLEGYFPTKPSQVGFKYDYVYRHIGWQIVGVDVEVRPPSK